MNPNDFSGIPEGMRIALREAGEAVKEEEIPVGAAVFKNGKAVSSAHNEREKRKDPTAHAEMLAIRLAAKKTGRRRLSGCTLYVTMEPCAMCAGAAMAAGIDEIVFGVWDEAAGCAGSVYALPEDPALGRMGRARCIGGIAEKECSQLLTAFFRRKRNQKMLTGRKTDQNENPGRDSAG